MVTCLDGWMSTWVGGWIDTWVDGWVCGYYGYEAMLYYTSQMQSKIDEICFFSYVHLFLIFCRWLSPREDW